jgi:hypothetical protein
VAQVDALWIDEPPHFEAHHDPEYLPSHVVDNDVGPNSALPLFRFEDGADEASTG